MFHFPDNNEGLSCRINIFLKINISNSDLSMFHSSENHSRNKIRTFHKRSISHFMQEYLFLHIFSTKFYLYTHGSYEYTMVRIELSRKGRNLVHKLDNLCLNIPNNDLYRVHITQNHSNNSHYCHNTSIIHYEDNSCFLHHISSTSFPSYTTNNQDHMTRVTLDRRQNNPVHILHNLCLSILNNVLHMAHKTQNHLKSMVQTHYKRSIFHSEGNNFFPYHIIAASFHFHSSLHKACILEINFLKATLFYKMKIF